MSLTISGTAASENATVPGEPKPAGRHPASTLVTIDPGVVVADPTRGTLTVAIVQIRGNYQFREDLLAFTPSAATGNIIGIFTLESGTLRLASFGNRATLAQWRAALDSVTYCNTATTPNVAPRTITISATGGIGSSLSSITVVPAISPLSDPISLVGIALPAAASGVAAP